MDQRKQGLCATVAAALAVVALAGAPAVALAGLPNAVIGAGQVQGAVVLQDARGHTVYMSTGDLHGRSSCYGSCLSGWNPVLTGAKVFARKGSGLNQKLLGTTRRRNGKLQVTYNHHPLYTDSADTRRGQDYGQACTTDTGATWEMLNKRGNPVTSPGPSCQFYG
jgi:predicted lipoprotein with Yx(FWY)xxD motif